MRGWLTKARASATRCFCPPDSTAGQAVSPPHQTNLDDRLSRLPSAVVTPAIACDRTPPARLQRSAATAATEAPGTSAAPDRASPIFVHRSQYRRRLADPNRPATAAACSCHSRCARRWRRTAPRGSADRFPAGLDGQPNALLTLRRLMVEPLALDRTFGSRV